MNLFILTDLEGIPGIESIDDIDRNSRNYVYSRNKLCDALNLAISIAKENGADNIYYLDGHGGGGNIFEDKIDNRAIKVNLSEWQQLLIDGKIDCQIELGAHTRAGTYKGFLDHTFSSASIFNIKINGIEMSEVSLHAMLCAKYNVPIIAVIGDETACTQAREYIKDVYVGPVKTAECRNVAKTYDNSYEIIKSTLIDALNNYKNVSLIKFKEPLTVEVTYYRTDMCEEVIAKHGYDITRVDARTISKVVNEIKKYEDLRF